MDLNHSEDLGQRKSLLMAKIIKHGNRLSRKARKQNMFDKHLWIHVGVIAEGRQVLYLIAGDSF